MTEDEAKKKWCPNLCCGGLPGHKVDEDIKNYHRCQASDCMMWEPYKYWINENGSYCAKDAPNAKLVEGGECGLKSKECNCSQ